MNQKRGVGTIVGTMLIVLLTIVGVGILWAVVSNVQNKATSSINSPDCITLSLEPIECGYATAGCYIIGSNVNLPNLIWIKPLKRNEGDGELRTVKLVVKDNTGIEQAFDAIDYYIPQSSYSFNKDLTGLEELATTDVAANFNDMPLGVYPVEVRVAAVTKDGSLCSPSLKSAACSSLTSINVPTCPP